MLLILGTWSLASCRARETERRPEDQVASSRAAPDGATSEREPHRTRQKPHIVDYRLVFGPDVEPAEIIASVEAAIADAGHELNEGERRTKCRRVAFLDAFDRGKPLLRGAGYSLRRRLQMENDCELETDRLAISFNLHTDDDELAAKARDELLPAAFADKHSKLRYKRSHYVGPGAITPEYLAGSTIRRLPFDPKRMSDLRRLFPALGLEQIGDEVTFETVGAAFQERNRDLGSITAGEFRVAIELATWHRAGQLLGSQLVYEHVVEPNSIKAAKLLTEALQERLGKRLREGDRLRLLYESTTP